MIIFWKCEHRRPTKYEHSIERLNPSTCTVGTKTLGTQISKTFKTLLKIVKSKIQGQNFNQPLPSFR